MELIKTSSLPVVVGANTKTEIESLADAIVTDLMDKGNPLELAEMLSSTEHLLKTIKSDVRFADYVKDELQKSSGKFTTSSGTKIEACETGVSYNYSQNPDWVELDKTIASFDVKKKQLEERLKKIPAGKLLVDESTGETLVGPSKSSKSSFKVTLRK